MTNGLYLSLDERRGSGHEDYGAPHERFIHITPPFPQNATSFRPTCFGVKVMC